MSSIERVQAQAVDRQMTVIQPNDSIAKIGPDGALVKSRTRVTLSVDRGEVYSIPRWYFDDEKKRLCKEDQWKLTVDGYYRLNAIAAVNLTELPGTVYERDQFGSVSRVSMGAVGVGLNALGAPCMVMDRIEFNVRDMLIADIMAKIKPKGKEEKPSSDCARLVPANAKRDPSLVYYQIDDALMLEVKPDAMDTRKIMAEYQEIKRFAERRARSILYRRILRAHPAIGVPGKVVPDRNGEFAVFVVGWAHSSEMQQRIVEAAKKLAAGVEAAAVLPEAEVKQLSEPLDYDDVRDPSENVPGETVADEEPPDALFGSGDAAAGDVSPPPVDRRKLVSEVQRLCRTQAQAKLNAACAAAEIPAVELLTDRDCAGVPAQKLLAFRAALTKE